MHGWSAYCKWISLVPLCGDRKTVDDAVLYPAVLLQNGHGSGNHYINMLVPDDDKGPFVRFLANADKCLEVRDFAVLAVVGAVVFQLQELLGRQIVDGNAVSLVLGDDVAVIEGKIAVVAQNKTAVGDGVHVSF